MITLISKSGRIVSFDDTNGMLMIDNNDPDLNQRLSALLDARNAGLLGTKLLNFADANGKKRSK